MAVRKTVEDLINAMVQAGVPASKIKRSLEALGFPGENIQTILAVHNFPPEDEQRLVALEELEKQKLAIESLREEVSRINATLSKLFKLFESRGGSVELEARVSSLEARLKGLIEAICEYAPEIARKAASGA